MNLKHLRYFREIARLGSIAAAARTLHLAPQTLSAQLGTLEESVGQPLFERVGRRLVLTPAGTTALEYANTIFALGDELSAVLKGRVSTRPRPLRVGSTDSVPKLLAVSVLQPLIARHLSTLELECVESTQTDLLARLAAGELDVVLSDAPAPAALSRTLQGRSVASSGMSFVATRAFAARLARGFPRSLDGAPFLAGSAPGSYIGQAIDAWFSRLSIQPRSVGHVDDSALLKSLAHAGLGVIAVPTSIESEVVAQYRLACIGRTEDVRQSVFLIRPRGRRVHPLVAELEGAATGG
jgi:LysR family transcriptional regulator, transcriptional activator of nhaA